MIFGEHTEKLCELLKQDYNIVGQDRTLEAATASVKGLPDLFLVTGTALASGLVEGDIKHGMALLTNLKKLRSSCPESRIVIILANKKLTKEIAKLGIYDIHVTEDISIEEIKGFLKTRKSFADCDVEVTTNETPGKVNVSETSTLIDMVEEKEKTPKKIKFPSFPKINLSNIKEKLPEIPDVSGGISAVANSISNKVKQMKQHKKTTSVQPENTIITVWNPTGYMKSFTALNLAAAHKAILLNFDFTCPELDYWFNIKQTGLEDARPEDAGILTLGDTFTTDIIPKLLKMKWGVKYLPVGNKLGNIGTPDFTQDINKSKDLFVRVIEKARKFLGIIIIDAGRDFELPPVSAALFNANLIIVPVQGYPAEMELVKQQLDELKRAGLEVPVKMLYINGAGGLAIESTVLKESLRKNQPCVIVSPRSSVAWVEILKK